MQCFYRFALDTAALLGGNEYLVSQIYEDRCQQSELTEKERLTLEWALKRLWRGHVIILTAVLAVQCLLSSALLVIQTEYILS